MSKHETPLTRKYWQKIGGTLIEEFGLSRNAVDSRMRFLDAVIIRGGKRRIAKQSEVDINGKSIVILQTKAKRLGMYLLGQAVFSELLIRKFYKPRKVVTVALCTEDDVILRQLAKRFKNLRVEII